MDIVDWILWAVIGAACLFVLLRPKMAAHLFKEFMKPPEQKLQERYERGELSREEYERRMRIIASHL